LFVQTLFPESTNIFLDFHKGHTLTRQQVVQKVAGDYRIFVLSSPERFAFGAGFAYTDA